MTEKNSSRATNPPYLGDYHRMRLYPRHWDLSAIENHNGSAKPSSQTGQFADPDPENSENFGGELSSKAFDDWHISRHYPSDDSYRCDSFSAF